MSRATNPVYTVYFRRRREGKTNFAKRAGLIKGGKPRMVVRKSNRGFIIQFVEYDQIGDKIIASANRASLKKSTGWQSKRNSYSAYLCGMLAASYAKKKKVSDFVLDIGMYTPSKGSVVFAALKGAVDAGLKTTFDESLVPSEKLSNVPEALKAQFEQAKKKILES
ncbi:MAG: 50S ribosomal protein L18 [Candidatus Micrarchaeia archaeon]